MTVLLEGDERMPCAFYNIAGTPAEVFDTVRAGHSDMTDDLWGVSLRTAHYVFVRLDRCSEFVGSTFRKWYMGDERNGQIDPGHYMACALERLDHWIDSFGDGDSTVIMDGGFLQNPISDLLFRGVSEDDIRSFVHQIADRLNHLNVLCIYLRRESVQAALAFAEQARGAA